ncbi:helix-turn-helix transcriptional regulator [Streptomyces sp. NPDC044948]|uniref:helix-turn-helix transcriptional regulator n=1 Tax=Streptomyces sp. NPDC044948 TaxID=3157092 RepID=UPI0033FBF95F
MAVMTVPRDPEAWERLGKRIREYREKAGYSRRALAEKAGVSEKSIQVTEEGRVPRGRMPQSLSRIEVALGWLPGTSISILNGASSIITMERQEVDVQLEPEGAYVPAEAPASPTAPLNSRDVELTHSGHLAQDIFMRQARRYRRLQEVSLGELAERARALGSALSVDDLKRLEDGTRLLRMKEAQALAKGLGTSVDWLLGSGFSEDAPEEMRWPPNSEELQAEANAVLRRLGDMGAQVLAAQQQHAMAKKREEEARQQAEMTMSMWHSAMAQEQEVHRHYQYLLGRIDSVRAAEGKATMIEMVPVYEEDDDK